MNLHEPSQAAWIPTGTMDDLETVPRPVSILQMRVLPRSSTDWHSHPRVQLLYATRGVMTVAVEDKTWIVPDGHALLISSDILHRASCVGALDLCSALVDARYFEDDGFDVCRILQVSALLDASLQALAKEPLLYDCDGRGGCLATLIVDEVRAAPSSIFPLPMPSDRRLQKLCQTLMETPSLALDLDSWAETVGLSRRTLTRRFREETNLSLAEWRRRLRAVHAMSQRAEGISEHLAATAAGYRSPAALRTMIKRISSHR